MKELQAKAKVTQTMTRDGLVMENQADGTVENVSSREAEQDYSADAEGKAEKILERAEDVKDKHKAKKKAKQAAETAESEDGLHRSAARLELTEEERADPALQPYIQKAEAKADKLDAARAALPKKRVPVKEKVYDAANGKAKSPLHFEQQDKGPPSLKPNPASRPLSEALLFAHGKIHEVEHENVGVEGGHKGEELVEHQTAKVIRSGIRHHKMKPYKAVEKAERQLMSANAEYFYQKSLRDNPQIAQAASNPISRMWQKRRIKQQYAKAARQAGQAAAHGAATTAENGFRVTKLAAEGGERVAEFAARNWKTILIVAVFGLLALLLITGLLLQEPQKIVKILGLRDGCIYGGFQFCLPAHALAVCVPLGIAFTPVLTGDQHRQAMFLAQPVAGAPDVGIAPPVGNIFALIHHVHSAKDDVVVDVPFVNVRG